RGPSLHEPMPLAPEPTALAANVQLVGELQGSGFRNRQWLLQQDGAFIQLTELLYLVTVQIDGQRSYREIADAVTRDSPWSITGPQVEHLIQTKLAPQGLLANPAGAAPPEGLRRDSPLGVN